MGRLKNVMVAGGTSHVALASGGGADVEETQGTKRGRGRDGTHLYCPRGLRASEDTSIHRKVVSKGADHQMVTIKC